MLFQLVGVHRSVEGFGSMASRYAWNLPHTECNFSFSSLLSWARGPSVLPEIDRSKVVSRARPEHGLAWEVYPSRNAWWDMKDAEVVTADNKVL